MALTPEQIDAINTRTLGHQHFARAIEAEVRKDDEALIRQMLEALDGVHAGEHQGGVDEAITAGRARLEGKP